MEPKIRDSLENFGQSWLVSFLLCFSILFSVFTTIAILGLPGSISVNRVILLIVPVGAGLWAIYLLVKNMFDPELIPQWIRKTNSTFRFGKSIFPLMLTIAIILLVAAFLPFSSLGSAGAFYIRIQPVLIFGFLLSVQILVAWIFFSRTSAVSTNSHAKKSTIIPGIVFGGIIVVITLVINWTGWGIGVGTQYWGKAGTPVLHWQIGLSLGIILAGVFLAERSKSKRWSGSKVDLGIFLLLWAAAFLVWQAVPIEVSRFTTRPYPPNFVSYPFSDSGDYVLSAESIWLGNGFQYGFIDKPLHLTFLSLISWLTGANMAHMILLQVAFLAVMPGLIYLIGSKLHSRPAGIMAGLLILFIQRNSLAATNRIQVSNVKMMLSEPLTAIMLLLFCLAVINWWKKPSGSWVNPALAGVILGLAGLVRMNALVIAPFICGAWLIGFGVRRKSTWLVALLFSLFCVLPLVPWMVRSQIKLNDPIAFVTSKTYGVLQKNRFNPLINHLETDISQIEQNEATGKNDLPENQKAGIVGLIEPMIHTGFHNLISVGLQLPASWTHTNLDDTIRQPYWDIEWDGGFTPGGQVVFAFSLIFVVIGFSAAWYKHGVSALAPLVVLGGYLLSNTISLVSGGRYIVPVDWVLPFYYSIGMVFVFMWLFRLKSRNTIKAEEKTNYNSLSGNWVKTEHLLFVAIFISIVPAALSLSIPRKYLPVTPEENISILFNEFPGLSFPFSSESLLEFSRNENAYISRGKAMFPRWMKTGEGDTGAPGMAFSALPFDHLSFTMLSETSYPFDVVLPINQQISYFPNSAEVLVFGCRSESYLDAALVVILSPQLTVYSRANINQLSCPLPMP